MPEPNLGFCRGAKGDCDRLIQCPARVITCLLTALPTLACHRGIGLADWRLPDVPPPSRSPYRVFTATAERNATNDRFHTKRRTVARKRTGAFATRRNQPGLGPMAVEHRGTEPSAGGERSLRSPPTATACERWRRRYNGGRRCQCQRSGGSPHHPNASQWPPQRRCNHWCSRKQRAVSPCCIERTRYRRRTANSTSRGTRAATGSASQASRAKARIRQAPSAMDQG